MKTCTKRDRYTCLITVVLLSLGLFGCGSSDEESPILMPDVTGSRLDVALSDIERAGIDDEVEILGGGMLGIVDESNWEVCDQVPLGGKPVDGAPRLTVERECNPDEQPESSEESTSAPSESDAVPTTSPEAAAPEPTPEVRSSAAAVEMEAKYEENLALDITELCGIDGNYSHWSCFYDGVEDGPGYLRVNLTTDGGWSEAELSEMATTAGRHWFNFIGCDYPDLDTIVVRVNGVDHNVFRSDTNVDLMCS